MPTDSTRPRVLLSAGMIQGGRSGVGRYVVELAQRLAERNEFTLLVAGLEADRALFPETPASDWITIPERAAQGVHNLWWHQASLPRILRRERCDLVHIPSYRRILARSPIPQLATIHDCAPFHLRDKYGLLRGFFGRVVTPPLAHRCDHIIAVSEFTKNDLMRFFGLPHSQVTTVLNGIDHNSYHPQEADAIEHFRTEKGLRDPFFLYVSRLEHPGKNHLRLIEGYEQMRAQRDVRHRLVLAGAPWHGAEVIMERIAASPYKADILTPGFLEEAELALWYAASEALVFPSLFEGFGLPLAEAMATGSRVLSSNRASLPEVGGSAPTYFDPESPEAIARALAAVATEAPETRVAAILQGLEQAARFDWDQAADETAQIYLDCLTANSKLAAS